MRLLKRHPDEDEAEVAESSAEIESRPPAESPATKVAEVADRPPFRPGQVLERVRTDDVVVTPWSWADAVVAILGGALALVGAVALVRTGIDSTWYQPVEEVLDASHTALLGVIELGVGAALMFVSAVRARALAGLIGLGVVAAGVLAVIETDRLSQELAIEDWWALALIGGGAVVAALSLVPRQGRIERVVRTTDLAT